ncbi:MAG: hypothetical protein ACN4E6_17100 [Qipengyuania pacifica]
MVFEPSVAQHPLDSGIDTGPITAPLSAYRRSGLRSVPSSNTIVI